MIDWFQIEKKLLKSPVLNDCDSVLKMSFIHTYIHVYLQQMINLHSLSTRQTHW